ncbi:hypothetical protein PQR33_36300 [Paraburkholderia sediminicola]
MKPLTPSEQKVDVRRLFRSKASGRCYALVALTATAVNYLSLAAIQAAL